MYLANFWDKMDCFVVVCNLLAGPPLAILRY
jgi:hypothetical protein